MEKLPTYERDAQKYEVGEMPKELIGSREESNVVELGWSRESEHVQLGTTSQSRLVAATVARADSRANYAAAKATVDPEEIPFTGWFVQLNRSDINILIRNLKKARDQAYGRDE